MECRPSFPAPPSPPTGLRESRIWWLGLLALLAWQGWLTLTLFGTDPAGSRLLDAEPVVSGRHPLHLYHGCLGAAALRQGGTSCCFDPAFQAGYPKTPVFDAGSRPAELILLLAGGGFRPEAYKIGLAICCLAVPLLLAAAARGAGLCRAGTCVAVLLGLLIWWGGPARSALEAGDLHLLLASVAAAAFTGLLLGYDRLPGSVSWLGLLLTGLIGWFAHPFLFALVLPLALVYYLSVGARHRLAWHVGLLLALAGGLLGNLPWLMDWVGFWWIRAPLRAEISVLVHRTPHTVWDAAPWGDAADRALAVGLFALGLVGVWLWNRRHERAAARLLGLGAAAFLGLAVASLCWEPLARLGAVRLVVPALLFAAIPATHAFAEGARLAARWTGTAWRGVLVAGSLVAGAALLAHLYLPELSARALAAPPLAIGLGEERRELVEVLQGHTTPQGRILWEDRPLRAGGSQWTALLPLLTGRAYLGGLDPNPGIEHGFVSFSDQMLAGRLLTDWSDVQLDDFCRRYNVGWVVCWSSAAVGRFRAWKRAEEVASLSDGGPGCLFAIRRPLSYALRGEARLVQADGERIALSDLVPEGGEIVLSLHYQAGLRASPGRVQVERELDPYDPIAFVRLRVAGPVPRVSLTWDRR